MASNTADLRIEKNLLSCPVMIFLRVSPNRRFRFVEFQADGSQELLQLDPALQDETDGVIMMNQASVAAASRFVRQSGYGNQDNGFDRRVQLKGIRVDCGGASSGDGIISVEIEFLEPFYGVVYSKGRHDDPRCRWAKHKSIEIYTLVWPSSFSFLTLSINCQIIK